MCVQQFMGPQFCSAPVYPGYHGIENYFRPDRKPEVVVNHPWRRGAEAKQAG